MAYQALYRKWRPRSFDGIVGQDALVETLKNQIRFGRIGHAYLFCGTRGTGKTTAAKIMARAVNCPEAAELGGNPCNACPVCLGIEQGSAMNVFEIDAASNNGVDNIRDIREEVEYPPVTGRYKVYIIDEVHMLSTGAFNALLKTLEEPPEYVIFILATTDPERLPATILSRCQRFDLRRIGRALIEGRLRTICEAEGAKADDDALAYIAELADGSMRDGLSILDRCISYHPEELKYEDVLAVVGAGDIGSYSALYRLILGGDTEGAVRKLGEIIDSGADVMRIIGDMITYLRNVLIAGSIGGDPGDILGMSGERLEMARADYALTDRERLIYILGEFAELPGRLRYSAAKRVMTEMLILKLCTGAGGGAAQAAPGASREAAQAAPTASREAAQAVPAGRAQTAAPAPAPNAAPPARADARAATAGTAAGPVPTPRPAAKPAAPPAAKPAAPSTAARSAAPGAATGGRDIDILREHRDELIAMLHPSNRPLFAEAVFREEGGGVALIFKNKINFRLASENKAENGVLKLRALAASLLGHEVRLVARPARPGEISTEVDRVTDEELKKINFPVDIE